MLPIRLYEFSASHYCEKVRWALDFKHVSYESRPLVPLFHIPRVLSLTQQTQLPVLKLGERVVVGSANIIDLLESLYPDAPSLYPDGDLQKAEALDLATFCDVELGPHVRRIAYYHYLPDKSAMLELLGVDQSLAGRAFLRVGLASISVGMRRAMRIDRAGYERSVVALDRVLQRLSEKLQGRDYLVGERFSVADLTVAALLSPLVRPKGSVYAGIEAFPASLRTFVETIKQRDVLDWVTECYRQYRYP